MVSWLEFSTLIGFALGVGMVLGLNIAVGEEAMASYGWRIPFLIAGPLGLIGLYIRLRLEDTPEFRALERAGDVSESPLRETITQNWKPILQVIGLMVIQGPGFYLPLTYFLTYLQEQQGFSATGAALSTILTLLVAMALIPPLGALSDRVGRKPLLIAACVGYVLLSLSTLRAPGRGQPIGRRAGACGVWGTAGRLRKHIHRGSDRTVRNARALRRFLHRI